MKIFFGGSWAYGCMLTLLLLHCGWGGLASGQEGASDQAAAAEADQPESEPSAAEQPADPLEQSRQQHLELAIAIAADFDSPAQQQAANVVAQQGVVDARFDAPVRAVLEAYKEAYKKDQVPSDEKLTAAIALLRHTTIEPRDQVSLLLDLLIAISLEGRGREAILLRQGHPLNSVPGTGVLIASRLRFLHEALAEELETRLAADQPPVVLYGAAGLTAEHGAALVPKLLAVAAESDDRFVKAAVFQAVGRIVESDSQRRLQAQRAAARAAVRIPSEEALDALAEKANVSPKSLEYAMRLIQRNDRNGDGVLTEKEWTDMLVDPSPADTNQDGQITVEEYAAWMQSRARR